MAARNITIGQGNFTQELRVGRPDGAEFVIFDRPDPDNLVLASNISEEQAADLVGALIEAFPALIQFSDFQIEARVVGLKMGVGTQPEPVDPIDAMYDAAFADDFGDSYIAPQPEPDRSDYEPKVASGWDHPAYDDCTATCVAARASVRLYGEAGHGIGPMQMAKQRNLDSEALLVAALSGGSVSFEPFESEDSPW